MKKRKIVEKILGWCYTLMYTDDTEEDNMKEVISYVIENKILQKLVLSKSTDKNIIRAMARMTVVKGETCVALETFYTDGKAIQKNYSISEGIELISGFIPDSFKQMNIMTSGGNCEVKVSKKNKITVIDRIKREEAETVKPEHNIQKKYIISPDKPVDFLVELGVQDKNGRIYDKKRSKFRQINRFIETVADVENEIINGDELYILDLCCGKSYLSFAVYYYFTQIKGYKVLMDCVDLKADVIEYCSSVAKKLNYTGLNFISGDINEFKVKKAPDLTVSLHACDIATDIVLLKGIEAGSRVIMSTPCCHHEMMGQLKPQGEVTDFILDHSILKQKFADAATDAIRCKFLEAHGYDVNAMELIDPEETPKNVLIRAVKRKKWDKEREDKMMAECENICRILGVEPYILKK